MVGLGIFLIIMGAGSLLLPMFDIQFRLMELVDAYQPYAGIIVAVIGAALVLMGMNRQPAPAVAVTPAPSAAREPGSVTSEGIARPEDQRPRP